MVEVLKGVDVSQWQGASIDWHAVKNAGASFAGVKCSEGVGYVDSCFSGNWTHVKEAGLVRISYHFARPDLGNTPTAEADWFLRCVGALQVGDIIALDIEAEAPNVDVAGWSLEWLRHVEQAAGFPPLLYTYLAYAQARLQDARLAHNPLWLALYEQPLPAAVPPWTEVAIHQHTDAASYPGLSPVDESVVARSPDQLKALGKPAPAAPPHPAPVPAPHPHPHKVVVTRDMLLRRDPHHDDIYDPTQLVYRGATLDVVGPEVGGWIPVSAGKRTGWVLKSNTRPLP